MKDQTNLTYNGNAIDVNGLFNPTHTSTYYYTNPYWYWEQPKIYGPASNPNVTISTTQNFYFILKPEVFITKNKSRLKIYDNKVHLNDNDEFEIELFNTTTYTLGVKFKMQGKYISEQHLVLEPGQHYFLDRYINESKKFKFSTYEVENDNIKVENAIIHNGDIEIEFYKKHDNSKSYSKSIFNLNSTGNINNYGNNTATYFNDMNTLIGNNTSIINTDSLFDLTTTNMEFNDTNTNTFKETGRIDKGNNSDQEFKEIDVLFETLVFHSTKFKILPLSQKPIEAKDLKPKCNSCNRTSKKNDKFCSNCGNKL